MKYIIVKANSLDKLTEEVQSKIDEGYIPQGGVCVANASTLIYAQAMILKIQ